MCAQVAFPAMLLCAGREGIEKGMKVRVETGTHQLGRACPPD